MRRVRGIDKAVDLFKSTPRYSPQYVERGYGARHEMVPDLGGEYVKIDDVLDVLADHFDAERYGLASVLAFKKGGIRHR